MPKQTPEVGAAPIRRLTPVYNQTLLRQRRLEAQAAPPAPRKALPPNLVNGRISTNVFLSNAWQATVTVKARSVAAARKNLIASLRGKGRKHYRFEPPRTDDVAGTVTMELTIVANSYGRSWSPRPTREKESREELLACLALTKGFLAGELRHIAQLDIWQQPLKPPALGPVLEIGERTEA